MENTKRFDGIEDAGASRGLLSLDVGNGWLSRFELAKLARGDLLVSENLAGQSLTLSFNGNFFAQAQLVIVDAKSQALCAARIKSLSPDGHTPPAPDRGLELCELLPFTIRLASASYALDSFYGAGVASLVHMDTRYSEEGNAQLFVAGIEVASGTLMVRDENWALRLEKVHAQCKAGGEVRTTKAYLPAGVETARAKVYDARRPDCVTKPMIELLGEIHAEFLRSLHLVLPKSTSIRMDSVDQLAFFEWVDSKKTSSSAVRVLSMLPTGRVADANTIDGLPRKLCINPTETNLALLDAGFEAEYKTWWQNQIPNSQSKICLLSEPRALAKLLPEPEEREQLASCLRNGWKRSVDARFAEKSYYGPEWTEEQIYTLIDKWSMILIVVFTVESEGGKDYFELVYPLPTLQANCAHFRT